ncbi:YkgJ family cysteine cluster protein [Oceanobacillus piezotolerans]|uniref:YkgJ family cysteine cluster protein n=1 Tax=Oceanobacillus piezotolerans TaxID=2448030 RepID=A0A498DAQ2_9BACI|nr:YkgJ family cysteine cluster protein [Oceanobacillus piezotolerans]RLL45110.1 YkgJ family cysteine cluster protein [Oceanobacillus piezotolerans]
MDKFLTYEEIQDRMMELQDKYEIDEDHFYGIVEHWANAEISIENKILASFQGLLQVVSEQITQMEKAVDIEATCRMGCAFCCYFPIIVNEMEAKLMKKAIEQFPADRRTAIERHLADYYEKQEPVIKQLTSLERDTDGEFKNEYRKRFLPCPLLDTKTNQCMAYEVRPIPCRTYVNYTNPDVCADNLMPKETVSFEFLYEQYMGALNEFMQFLYEEEGDTAFITYPDDLYREDYLVNWFRR